MVGLKLAEGKKKINKILLLLLLCMVSVSANAAVIALDDFNYADGLLTDKNGGAGWSGVYTDSGSSLDLSGGAIDTANASGGQINFRGLSTVINTTNYPGGEIWMGFDGQIELTGSYGYGGPSPFIDDSEAGIIGAILGRDWFSISGGSTTNLGSGPLRIVVKFDLNTNSVELWNGPVGGSVDVSTAPLHTGSININGADNIRFAVHTGNLMMDNFILATTADEVVSATPPLIITPNPFAQVAESGATQSVLNIQLANQPMSEVAILFDPNSSNDNDITLFNADPDGSVTLFFNETNWNLNQSLTVQAVDDPIEEADQENIDILITFSSTDPAYDLGQITSISVTVEDDDFIYPYLWDLSLYYADAPPLIDEQAITLEMAGQMDAFDSAYATGMVYPNGVGLTTEQMQQIDDIVHVTFLISRDPQTDELTGRPIVRSGEGSPSQPDPNLPASFYGDWVPNVNTVIGYYGSASASQQPAVEQAYLDLVELLVQQGMLPGSIEYPQTTLGTGYSWRNVVWKSMRMAHTLPADIRNHFGLSQFYISSGHLLTGGASTDYYHNFFSTAFKGLALVDDNAFKWQLLTYVRWMLDRTILNGLITPEGGIVHHSGHHISYASYSFPDMVWFHRNMTDAGFTSEDTPSAIARFRLAAKNWAWYDTNGDFPVHFQLRPNLQTKNWTAGLSWGKSVNFLDLVADLTASYYGTPVEDDLELAYLAIAKTGERSTSLRSEWQSIILPPLPTDPQAAWYYLHGHETFQTMGAAAHRRDNWLASIRGANGNYRGGEAYDAMGRVDHFQEPSMKGSLLLITEGYDGRTPNPSDSGCFFEGWNNNYYPNLTDRINNSVSNTLYWRTPAYFGGGASLTGGANLFDDGIWFYAPSDNTQRKSAFFFGNRITLITDQINYDAGTEDVITGLIQMGHKDFSNQPLVLNGTSYSGTGVWTLPDGGDHSLVDGNGNGYYIHPGSPALNAERDAQQWYYGLSAYWIGPGSMPYYTYRDDREGEDGFVPAVNAGYFSPTQADYTRVYFNHGTAPTNDSLTYTVLVKPAAGELDTFVSNMTTPGSEPFTLDTSNDRHLVYDIATDTYAAVLFTAGHTVNQGGVVSMNRDGAYMWRLKDGLFYLSCGSSHSQDGSAFSVVIDGEWGLQEAYRTDGAAAAVTGGQTTVTLPYRGVVSQTIILTAGNNSPKFIFPLIVKPDAREATAYFDQTLAGSATDTDTGDTLTYRIVSGPIWLTMAADGTGALSGTPDLSDRGRNVFTVEVSDGHGGIDQAILNITVDTLAEWFEVSLTLDTEESVLYEYTGSSIAAVLTDLFDYDSISPEDPLPVQTWDSGVGYHHNSTIDAVLAYTFDGAYADVVLDLYGRDLITTANRDNNLTIEFYNGSWDEGRLVETISSFDIVDASPWYSRVTLSPGITADRFKIIAPHEAFTLMELRAAAKLPSGDINSNGQTGFEDLQIMANQWLQTPGIPSADIAPVPAGDGIINLLDFAELASDWLYY